AAAPGVPEPASWALLITGFGLVGVSLRRQRPALARV
ncbi:MAG: motif, partial [Pseudomonadota bacterium]